MNIELSKDVKASFVLKTYNKLSKLKPFIYYFKWIAAIFMLLGFIDTFLFDGPHKFTLWSNVSIWIPGILFAFVFGIFHFLTGLKIQKLSKKYDIHQFQLKIIVDRILN